MARKNKHSSTCVDPLTILVFCPYLVLYTYWNVLKLFKHISPMHLNLIQLIKVSLNFNVFPFFLTRPLFFCHITAPTVHTDDEEFQRISTLFREKTSRGDEVQHITSSSLLQLGIALWLRSFRIFPYAQRDGTREVRHKNGNTGVCSGDCFQPFQVQRLKLIEVTLCSTVQLFREQSSCQTFSQGRRVCLPLSVTQDFLSQSSWQCLASFWWEKIKAVNKGRISINKLQEKN